MSLLSLRDSCRLYERKARKVRGAPMSLEQFNAEHGASLPTSQKAIRMHKKYLKQLARAKKQHGVPLNARAPSLYRAFRSDSDPQLKPRTFSNVAEDIPTRREKHRVQPGSVGAVPKVESSVSRYVQAKEEFEAPAAAYHDEHSDLEEDHVTKQDKSIADAALAEARVDAVNAYKNKLDAWMKANPKSKLHKTSQVVHFVSDKATAFSPEETSAKLTRNTGNMLKAGGGEFKTRSGSKRTFDILEEDVQRVLMNMKSHISGPYFVRTI